MKYIVKIKLKNFKKFKSFEIEFDEKLNLLIGDNEAGKSSILTAIDLVIGGSRNKVENLGLDNLFNSDVIEDFLNSDRNLTNLPELHIELYLNEQNNEELSGINNLSKTECDGLKLVCKPNDELQKDIAEILKNPNAVFPFEFYLIEFKTFCDQQYTGFRRYLKHIIIDNSQMSNEFAMKEYVREIFNKNLTDNSEKFNFQNQYRLGKEDYKNKILSPINGRIGSYDFGLKTNTKSNLETDLTIFDGKVMIENKGKGKQCLIKTELVLQKSNADLDVILLEEPENHLSHINMKLLIRKIRESTESQIFIATHSDLISARLDLRKTILLNSSSSSPLLLKQLPDDTARFFMKAPDNNILQYVLSKKVILVEGDAEYILMEAFFEKVAGVSLESENIHIISIGGISFKRYLDIARILNVKTAVIRDNDKNYQENCVENYSEYIEDNIKVFSDNNDERNTFEICIYQDNPAICDELFKSGIRVYKNGREPLTVQQYMINNKADAAFSLLENKIQEISVPQYINDAIKWIRE
jgi:putative ATP-dependent endonuclease of the OLD family